MIINKFETFIKIYSYRFHLEFETHDNLPTVYLIVDNSTGEIICKLISYEKTVNLIDLMNNDDVAYLKIVWSLICGNK